MQRRVEEPKDAAEREREGGGGGIHPISWCEFIGGIYEMDSAQAYRMLGRCTLLQHLTDVCRRVNPQHSTTPPNDSENEDKLTDGIA
jgi:hypothetical protein